MRLWRPLLMMRNGAGPSSCAAPYRYWQEPTPVGVLYGYSTSRSTGLELLLTMLYEYMYKNYVVLANKLLHVLTYLLYIL